MNKKIKKQIEKLIEQRECHNLMLWGFSFMKTPAVIELNLDYVYKLFKYRTINKYNFGQFCDCLKLFYNVRIV